MLPTTSFRAGKTVQFSTVRPKRCITRRSTQCASSAEAGPAETVETPTPPAVAADNKPKAYVGKGRYLSPEDVPREFDVIKKTGRDSSLVGGFAGGEVGLKSYVAAYAGEKKPAKEEAPAAPKGSTRGKKSLYVGKGKYYTSGERAQIVQRTGREGSLTGGFAGGELGLQSFVTTGDVTFGEGRRQQSPLIIAGVLSTAGVIGGVLLTDVSDLGERVVAGSSGVSPAALSGLDENTKLLLEIAVISVGVVGTLVGGQALLSNFTQNLKQGATRLATLAAFWVAVFVAARFILDS